MTLENPYQTEFPADPKTFVGREKELSLYAKALDNTIYSKPPTPVNIAVLGDWGIGKTSLINKFADIAEKKDCLVFKNTLTPQKCRSTEQFFYDTLESIHHEMWDKSGVSTKLKEKISEWKIESLKISGLTLRKEKIMPSIATNFYYSLYSLWEKTKDKTKCILILYDDFHYLVGQSPDFLYDMRGVFQDLRDKGCRYMLILTGLEDTFKHVRGISEPLMRFFEHLELNTFNFEETKRAVEKPLEIKNINLKIPDEVIERIHNATLGHPYFVKFIAHDLFEYKSEGIVDLRFFATIYPKIFDHLSASRFIKDLAIASSMERSVLTNMAKKEDIIKVKDLKVRNVGMHLSRLEDKKLVKKVNRGEYKLYHPLFKEYLSSRRFK
ncbi:MAG: AAA family ATPase [Thermoplasmatales archaeon]|nr:AAA family ATPase [Thermoplasmatales archaeon]